MGRMKHTNKISSRDNGKLVMARRVRDGKIEGLIFVEGLRLAEEVLRSGLAISECFVAPGFADAARGRELMDKIEETGVVICEVSENLFQSLADTSNSQGIIVIAARPTSGVSKIEENLRSKSPVLVVMLHEVNDPSNLGSVFRTAEAVGVAGIIVSKGSADVFSPKALRAAMGASFRVPVWEKAGLNEVIAWSRLQGLRTTAADIDAEIQYTQVDWRLPRLVVFGSEAHGLTRNTLEMIDEVILIPMQNKVESLNLAVSAGIILFEAVRQNQVSTNK